MNVSASTTLNRWMPLAGVLAVGWLLLCCAYSAWAKMFAVDEFYYAHRSWWNATQASLGFLQGIPFVGTNVLYGPLTLLAGANPQNMLWLRLVPFLFLLLFLFSIVLWLRTRETPMSGVLGCCMILTLTLQAPTPLRHMLEIRPDGPAWALVAAGAVAMQVLRRPAWRFLLSWGCFALACTLTVKAWVVLLGLLPFLIQDVLARFVHHRKERSWFPNSGTAILLALLGLVLFVLLQGPVEAWKSLVAAYRGVIEHQRAYPSVNYWHNHLAETLRESFWLFALALVGFFHVSARSLRCLRHREHAPRDLVWLGLFVGACLSYFTQKAPFAYSTIPLWGSSVMLATLGIEALLPRLLPLSQPLRLSLVALLLLVASITAPARLWPLAINSFQLQTLGDLGEWTLPDDRVFDCTAGFAYRPAGSIRPFIDMAYLNRIGHAEVHNRMFKRLHAVPVPVWLMDLRIRIWFEKTPLYGYLRSHYVPRTPDLHLWGQRWVLPPGQEQRVQFTAFDSCAYFVHVEPEHAPVSLHTESGAALSNQSPFPLERGQHTLQLRWTAPANSEALVSILWLPRDGNRWEPLRNLGAPEHQPRHAELMVPR